MYLEVGYVGNKGTHVPLSSGYNVNQPTIAGYAKDQCYSPANKNNASMFGPLPSFSEVRMAPGDQPCSRRYVR